MVKMLKNNNERNLQIQIMKDGFDTRFEDVEKMFNQKYA
jgi:hypothetical protein